MVKNLQYKRILLACSLVLVSFIVLNGIAPQESISFDLAELPDNYMVIEGYVVSKRINSIWLAEESISFIGIVSNSVKGYSANDINISKNKDFEKIINFRQLKLNQKVRVYCDYVRESNPPKTEAFYIEIIENND
ncbi:DUF3221 domain-containing protein [Sporosarcina limicola]|uniref:DUF3221 domain-containing protein n=1 Tax=Sporosarcina limicola TaxID=34101 RepID=A0A927MHG4_9BACL|nr:DUF3221 domain-containing protein [Sporosarcina limicola]MBE1553851.1 hypothetical protein [Sporosarcina limicola]